MEGSSLPSEVWRPCAASPLPRRHLRGPPPVLAPANPLQKQVAESIMNDPVMKGMDCEQKLRTVVHVQAAYQMHLLFEPSIRTGCSPSGAVSSYPLALLKSSAMGESRRPEPPGLAASFSRIFVSVDTPDR